MRAAPFLAFATCALVWGSTWLAIKVGYAGVAPFTGASLRFLLAAAVLAPVVVVMRLPWPRGRALALAGFVGVVLFAADYGLIYWGEQFLASGLTAVLFATLPIFTAFLAHAYVPGERLTARTLGGALLGLAGVAVLFRDGLALRGAPVLPMLAILASALCAGASSVATKRHGKDVHPVALTCAATFVGGVVLAAVALVAGEGYRLPTTRTAWGSVVYLALAGSVLTFLLYFWLLKRWPSTTASFIAVVTPLVAVLLGALVGEPVTWGLAVGAALVVAGVLLASGARVPGLRTRRMHEG